MLRLAVVQQQMASSCFRPKLDEPNADCCAACARATSPRRCPSCFRVERLGGRDLGIIDADRNDSGLNYLLARYSGLDSQYLSVVQLFNQEQTTLGFDLEWKFDFRKHYRTALMQVQLSTSESVELIEEIRKTKRTPRQSEIRKSKISMRNMQILHLGYGTFCY